MLLKFTKLFGLSNGHSTDHSIKPKIVWLSKNYFQTVAFIGFFHKVWIFITCYFHLSVIVLFDSYISNLLTEINISIHINI